MTRFPCWSIDIAPDVPLIGLSRLATQTTVCLEILWYHIPTYLRLDVPFPGLKNPSAKVSLLETKRSPSLMGWVGVMVSLDLQNPKKRNRGKIILNTQFSGFIIFGW
ncbi:hypothetical protein CsSME_00049702 [Camellia sinensis var. sinensis]